MNTVCLSAMSNVESISDGNHYNVMNHNYFNQEMFILSHGLLDRFQSRPQRVITYNDLKHIKTEGF